VRLAAATDTDEADAEPAVRAGRLRAYALGEDVWQGNAGEHTGFDEVTTGGLFHGHFPFK